MKSKFWLLGLKKITGLFLIGIGFLVLWVLHETSLVLGTRIQSWDVDVQADCAVVLTGGAGRLRAGLGLLQKKAVKTLIISGVHPSTELQDLITPVDRALGVRAEEVVLEKRSLTTFGNAQQTAALVEALRCQDLVLVTSQLHMYRARRTFQAALAPDFSIVSYAIPSSRSETDRLAISTEVLKSMFYSVWAYPGFVLSWI